MGRRDRKKVKKTRIKKVIRGTIGIMLCIILGFMLKGICTEEQIRLEKEKGELIDSIEEGQVPNDEKEKVEENNKEKIPEEYKGYPVAAKLEVPTIKLDTNVLQEYSIEGLKLCASKYWGPQANQIGNFCIAGHNYEKENMFNHLIDLQIGDSLYLTDNVRGRVEYSIYDIYKVKPQNVEPLGQQTNGKREVTLITCTNYSKYRMIVKARER